LVIGVAVSMFSIASTVSTWMNACVPAVRTRFDSGFPASLHEAAPGAAIAIVVVFETIPPALIDTGTQHPGEEIDLRQFWLMSLSTTMGVVSLGASHRQTR